MAWVHYNPNPCNCNVGDCTIRALTKALNKDWESVYAMLCAYGYMRHDMPSANHVWGECLRQNGFERYIVEDYGKIYTVKDFCRDNPNGTFVLAIQGHVVTVVDGDHYDTWDSGNEIPLYYWKR